MRLIGSGAILREVIAAAELLHSDWGVASEIFSATSFSELAREARGVERYNRLHPGAAAQNQKSYLEQMLCAVPTIAATDYVRAYGELIAPHVRGRYVVLGTDGFGRSDTRAALRAFFEIDRHQVVVAALAELVRDGQIPHETLQSALTRYRLDVDKPAPWTV